MEQNERSASTRSEKRLAYRSTWRIVAAGVVGILGLLAVAAYAMFVSLPGRVRVAPVSIVVHSSSTLPTEVQALEAQTALFLFDRDTTTAHVAYADQSIDTQLEHTTEIQSIKVFGAAPYELTVQALQGSAWNTITGLSKLKLSNQPAGWNNFQATQAVTTSALRFLLTLPSGNGGNAPPGNGGHGNGGGNTPHTTSSTVGGLPEIEIWATGEHALINGAALVAAMPSGTQANTQPKPAQARAYVATPASAVVGKDGQSFSFTLDRPAARFKRAWLAYETYGLAHWVSPVRRINGLSLQGGAFTFSGSDWTLLTEPIQPDWLVTGNNRIDFSMPPNLPGNYSVRNVRVVAELDDGNNFIARATTTVGGTAKATGTETDASALIDGDLTTGWSPYVDPHSKGGNPALTLYFDKPTQLDTLSLNLVNALSGTLNVDLLVGGQWQNAGIQTINGKKLSVGWNSIPGFAQVAADALRITFLNGNGSPGEISEIAATGSGSGTAYVPAINVAYPDAGQFYGRQAYIRGFLSVPDNGTGPAVVTIGGKSVPTPDGSFGVVVSKDDTSYANQADAEPWQVEIDALYPNGQKLIQIINLTQANDASKAHGLLPSMVNPGFAEMLVGGDASLDIGPDALDQPIDIKITPLAEKDLPALDPGMTNVTPAPKRGYRFTPHGAHFKKDIKVTIPYDPALVPVGLTETDVKTFYFDTTQGHWVELARFNLDSKKHKVTSFTNHFTDMISATLTTPDHPETTSFNATQMKDIKAADPGAGINLIESPKPNNMGDARLSYPIEIPQGRQGMQPQLGIQYNSSGGNGWLGLGWDLSVPSITIDTRWGVPRYDTNKETETYMLNGEMLTPVAHRGTLQDRTAEKIFHTRVEGQFRRIIRHGDKPTNYWWEVIDKNGMKNYYGGTGTAQDAGSVLGGANGVFKWALRKTKDTHNNTVNYNYARVCDTGTNHGTGTQSDYACDGGGVAGYQLYIQSIDYTGTQGGTGPYTVTFVHDRDLGEPRRADVQIDARGGFKQVTADLLRKIEVRHNTDMVRSYELVYKPGAFNKTLLQTVSQNGKDGGLFNTHTFAYFDEVWKGNPAYAGFGQNNTWHTGSDLSKKLLGVDVGPSALSGSEGSSIGGSVSVGFGMVSSKIVLSANAMAGQNQGTSHGTVAMVDIDGDGLPDKVYVNGGVWYRRNLATPGSDTGEVTFGPPQQITGISAISENENSSFNFGGQGYAAGVNLIGNMGYSQDTQHTYFSDVNGDGLIDLVYNGTVYFNRINSTTKRPEFQATSSGTPYPISTGVLDTTGLLPVAQFQQIESAVLAQNPLMDSVRRWTAPYNGTISISGSVQLVQVLTDARNKYKTADGVRAVIEKQGESKPRWSRGIRETDYAVYDPQADEGTIPVRPGDVFGNVTHIVVQKGDILYFRVQSIFDGAYDQVNWAPVITYTDKPAQTADVNGLNPYRYDASQEFIYGGRVSPVALPFRGTIQLKGVISKLAATTDDVAVAVYYIPDSEFSTVFAARHDYSMLHLKKAPLYRSVLARNVTGDIDLSAVPPITVANAHDNLVVIVETDSNIDLSKVIWKQGIAPQIYYTAAYASDLPPTDASGNPVPGINFTPGAPLAVKDDNGYTIHPALPTEFNFYSDNTLTQAQESWTAPEMGWVVVTPAIQLNPQLGMLTGSMPAFPYNTEVILTAKQRGKMLFKRVMRLNQGTAFNSAEHSFAMPVPKDQQIYFDLSTRDPDLAEYLVGASVNSHYVRPVVTALIDAIPLNQPGQVKSWNAIVAGTVTVNPKLAAKAGAKAASGNIVLQVTQPVTSLMGITTQQLVVNRVIPFDTQKPYNPQDYAFDVPMNGGDTLNFTYTTDNASLASQLGTEAVNLTETQQYAHQDNQLTNVPLTVNSGTGNTNTSPQTTVQLPVAQNGWAAVAPTISLNGSNVFGFDVNMNLVVTRQYSTLDAQGNPVVATQQLANYPIALKAGDTYNPGANTFDVPVLIGDTLLFEFMTKDSTLPGQTLSLGAWAQLRQEQGSAIAQTVLPSMLHRYGNWQFFANAYRGWSYGGYNGDGDFAGKMIDTSRFTVSGNTGDYQQSGTGQSMSNVTAFIAAPQPGNTRWIAGDDDWQITATGLTSSRMGLNYVKLPRPEDLATVGGSGANAGSGATAVPRMSLVEGESSMGGGFIINISESTTPGKAILDFMDLNGDRFPDIIGSGNIQYTQMTGGLGGGSGSTGDGFVRSTQADSHHVASAGSTEKAIANAKAFFNPDSAQSDAGKPNEGGFGMTGGLSTTNSSVHYDLVDVNGDGLPDRVRQDGGLIKVKLNLGYTFDDEETWGAASLDDGYQQSINIGASYNDGAKGDSGGASLSQNQGRVDTRLMDINGDGLPDRVTNSGGVLMVGFNRGGNFAPDVPWAGLASVNAGTNQSFSLGGGGSFDIPIGPLCLVACYISINPGVSIGTNTGRAESSLQDVNGDGLPDFVASTKDDTMDVALNRTGKTNLLQTVTRPLGAIITLDYTRDGNTYEMPQSRWVINSVSVDDSHHNDGVDLQKTAYTYSNGQYDRYERDFYGYQTVTEQHIGTATSPDAVYRSVVSTYLNGNYYDKGLELSEQTLSGGGNLYRETLNTYKLRDRDNGAEVVPTDLDGNATSFASSTFFPMLLTTTHNFYEGGSQSKSTYTTQVYDDWGNITSFTDAGDLDIGGNDVTATIGYSLKCLDSSYVIGKPLTIEVRAAGQLMRSRTGIMDDCTTGDVTQLSQDIGNGTAAVTTLTYDSTNGNLLSVTGPENTHAPAQRYGLTYIYDPDVATYVASVTDSFNYTSSATYDYLFGKPLTTTDLNNNVISYVYDQFGRTVSVNGPYQQPATADNATLKFDYHPEGLAGCVAPNCVPYATTDHLNLDAAGNVQPAIRTVLFTDGLKRVLQTKKSVAVNGTAMLAVSGHVEFDAMGRTIKQYYPVTEPLGMDGTFNLAVDSIAPTETVYDVLDRTVQTLLPDRTIPPTTIAYGFGSDKNRVNQFKTTVTDANGKTKESYRDVRELITSVKETNNKVDIWTSYSYDPLKQIVQVRDAKGNLTTATYDNLGRRTSLSNPDTGTTQTVYDTASNVVSKITANLAAAGATATGPGQARAINYVYDYNRLTAIHYPNSIGNNVTYTYGAAGLSNGLNQIGRIVKVTDASGSEERVYGKLGETIKEVRTIASHTQGKSANSPEVYTTQYHYDTFGRILTLTLPDTEIITYGYDSGGNLASFAGDKNGNHTPYLQTLFYDKFEQRTYMKLGNNVETHYTYKDTNRRLINLMSQGSVAGKFQNLGYKYDSVGNILGLKNDTAIPAPSGMGGPTNMTYGYDDLYRLTSASGKFQSSPDKTRNYTLVMGYDDIHNITNKTQTDNITNAGGAIIPQKATSYDWTYAYAPLVGSGPTPHPHAPIHIGTHTFSYDADGNQLGWSDDKNGTRRIMLWDEDNRISEIDDNGQKSRYTYDDKGERVIKVARQGETVYVNQYYVVRNRSIVSKHLYAGTSRIATRMVMGTAPGNSYTGSGSSTGSGQVGSTGSGQGNGQGNQGNAYAYGQSKDNPGQGNSQANNGNAQGKGSNASNGHGPSTSSGQGNGNNAGDSNQSNLPGNSEAGLENALANGQGNKYGIYKHLAKEGDTVDASGEIVAIGDTAPGSGTLSQAAASGQSDFTYYYHPDHLGSTGYVTDANGKLYEHLEYFPFGETWVQEHSNTLRTPYLFTGKEFDQETGLYYFGARYYDPRTSVWQSADAILGKYLPGAGKSDPSKLAGMGGVFNTVNLAMYTYVSQNPLKYTDPDGNELDVSESMKPAVEKLMNSSQTAAGILNSLKADPRKFSIREGVEPSGGSAANRPGGTLDLIDRLMGKEPPKDVFVVSIDLKAISKSNYQFKGVDGKGFHPSVERVLGHELGHASIFQKGGQPELSSNQVGAVNIENKIAREINPSAPVRHPTEGHGSNPLFNSILK